MATRTSREYLAEMRSISILESDGYTVIRTAPSQQPPAKQKACDAVNLVALKDWEVLLVAVRTERRVSSRELRRLHEMKKNLSHSRIVEWHWANRAREPEEVEIA